MVQTKFKRGTKKVSAIFMTFISYGFYTVFALTAFSYSNITYSALVDSKNVKNQQKQTLSVEIRQYLLSAQYTKALPLLKNAAQQDNNLAQYQIALLYLNGNGVNKSKKQAERWLLLAAGHNKEASYLLGSLYSRGNIISQDLNKAKYYLSMSQAQGNKKAKRLYQSLFTKNKIKISPEQLQADLVKAIKKGQLSDIMTLYKQGVNLTKIMEKQSTPLMTALEHNNENIALWLIKTVQKESNNNISDYLNVKNGSGNTALHIATQHKMLKMVSLLIQCKANVNAVNIENQSALIIAVLNGDKLIAQHLVNSGALTSIKDKMNKTALDYAKKRKLTLVIKPENDHKKATNKEINSDYLEQKIKSLTAQASDNKSPYFGWPILTIAVAQKQHLLIDLLLNKKHEPWELNPQNENAILVAIKQEQTKLAIQLLNNTNIKKNSHIRDIASQLSHLFYAAIKHNNFAVIEVLLPLTSTIDLTELSIDKSPLWQAITLKNTRAFSLLVRSMPLDFRRDKKQRTLLLLASELNLTEISLQLMTMKMDVNAVNNKGRNALWYAANFKNNDLIQHIISAKSRIQTADLRGHTALIRAVIKDCLSCVTSLLNAGADAQKQTLNANSALLFASQDKANILQTILDFYQSSAPQKTLNIKQRNNQSFTALMLAIKSNNDKCVELLLTAGANPKRKNNNGENSFDLAKSKPSILALLKRY